MLKTPGFLLIAIAFFIAGTLACVSGRWGISRPGGRLPVILDTDIGDDIDDTWALALLLGSPQVDLKLIVTETGDTAAKTRLVAKILERMGRTDVAIGTGIKTGDAVHNQTAWLGDFSLARYPGVVHADGVQALIDAVNASPGPVTLCAIGPETNLREALRRDPAIAKKARVVAMAGSVFIGYAGKRGRDAEYNVAKDIEAVRAVFAAPWPITWAPLDSCGNFRIAGEPFARLSAAKAPRARTVMENYALWAGRKQYPAGESSILFDTLGAYLCLADELCDMKTVKLRIDDKGFSVPDERGRAVRCALALKNPGALAERIITALTRP